MKYTSKVVSNFLGSHQNLNRKVFSSPFHIIILTYLPSFCSHRKIFTISQCLKILKKCRQDCRAHCCDKTGKFRLSQVLWTTDTASNCCVFWVFLYKSETIFRNLFHSEILKFLPQKAVQNGGERQKFPPPFFCKKWRTKTQVFSSLCRQAQLHSKNKVFSSHLHQIPEALLVKSLPEVACEEVSLRCPWSCRLSAGGCVSFILRFA